MPWWFGYSFLVAAALVLMVLMSSIGPPSNAIMLVDHERATFAGMSCALNRHTERRLLNDDGTLRPYAEQRRFEEILAAKPHKLYRIDPSCLGAEHIFQPFTQWLVSGSRWKEDGEWRW